MSPESKRWSVFLLSTALCVASVVIGRRGVADPMVPKDGKVLILEFSDYQCPACRGAEPILRRMLDYYGDKVTWVHKHFPLEQAHKFARLGSVSAVCVERQGKFKAWHELLFTRQQEWTGEKMTKEEVVSKLRGYASELKLDLPAFDACLADPAADKQVTDDFKEGKLYNIRSTPTFFINGIRLLGSQQLSQKGAYLIDKNLKAQGVPPQEGAAKEAGK